MQATESETERVLVVDDDPHVVELVCTYLQRTAGAVTVETTTDPETAVESVEAESFSCVVSDYEMPEMDGLELLTAVRDRAPGVPFVLFTIAGDEAVAERAREHDALYLERGTSAGTYRELAECVDRRIGAD
jgi:CheY-like chemotaxis protein